MTHTVMAWPGLAACIAVRARARLAACRRRRRRGTHAQSRTLGNGRGRGAVGGGGATRHASDTLPLSSRDRAEPTGPWIWGPIRLRRLYYRDIHINYHRFKCANDQLIYTPCSNNNIISIA